MKKIAKILATTLVLFALNPISVESKAITPTESDIVIVEQLGDYIVETVISDAIPSINVLSFLTSKSNTITKTKTSSVKDSNNKTLWQVSITATFKYDGKTAECTSYTYDAKSSASAWSIDSVTGSKNGNSATATATAKMTGIGGVSQSYTRSVTITCSPTGTVS